jgi:lysophospholipase L1-like esterase
VRSSLLVLVLLGLGVSLLGAPTASAALPNWMAGLGDSITRGYGSSGAAGSGDNLSASWSTGTDSAVNSHYSRLLAVNPAISGNGANYAVNGSKMSSTFTQAQSAVTLGAEYVTIMSGTNDVCTTTVAQMTSVSTFQSQLTSTLNRLTSNLPNAKILVASIPNWYGLWQAFQSNPSALSAWSTWNNRCPVLLGSGATQSDRDTFRQRIIDLNNAQATACSAFPACTYDNGAVYNLSFSSTDLAYDYFHMSITGQALLALATWNTAPYTSPLNTGLPVISGVAQEGQILSSSTGSWSGNPTSYTYQWRRCDGGGGNCANIAGATGSSYQLSSGDVSSRIRVAVTATNANGFATASSSATQAVTPPPPVNTDLPAISGVVQEGQTLNTTTGGWTGNPTSFSYQWRRCASGGGSCTSIGGATASSYQLAGADVSSTIRVVVTATNGGGSASATSDPTGSVAAAPPSNTGLPTISGLAQEGQTLTAGPGTWTDSPTYAYQWLRCDSVGGNCLPVGAGGTTYVLGSGDVGARMRAEVTATNGAGSASATSNATGIVTQAPPANTAAPEVSGTPQEGETLEATNGTWTDSPTSFSYQWRRCDGFGGSCVNIAGATGPSHVLGSGDVGFRLRVRVAATNSGGSGTAESDPTAAVTALPPVNNQPPAVSGTAQEDQTLNATSGTWSGSNNYAYQWLRCNGSGGACAPIGGQTGTSYQLTGDDVDSRIRIQVTASNSGGSAVATSDATAVVEIAAPANTALPTVSGTAQQGQTLTAAPGTWTHTPTYTYQWLRCNGSGGACAPISSQTATSYNLAEADIGSRIRVEVTATNDGGTATANSNATPVVIALPPTNDTPPAVTGTAEENRTLTTTNGTWTGNNPSYTYQWQRCNSSGTGCTPISGATTSSYQLTTNDIGSTIRAAVTATNSGGATTATSDPTTAVTQAPPTNTTLPTISGTTQEGQTLSATTGTWTGNPTYAYQWMRCNSSGASCGPVGAGGSTYALVSGDVGSRMRVEVTATNGGGSVSATSNATAVVTIAPPANTAAPQVSGTAQEGQTLNATTGSWTETATFGYQWRRCNGTGGSCVSISGATNSSYTLSGSDIDSTIRVRVTATNDGGAAAADSDATSVVTALPPVNSTLPSISGTAQEGQTLTATTGTWTGHSPTYARQWLRCDGNGDNCAPIAGQTGTTYSLVGDDVDGRIEVKVTATNSGGSTPATSNPTAVVKIAAPTNTALPAISGTAQEGQTLTASAGTWTHSPTFGYQWRRCNSSGASCVDLSGETGTNYVLTDADIGSKMRVHVTATNNGGSAGADSNPTALVIALPPVNNTAPVVSGTTVENQTLSTTIGSWSGNNPSYSYQWQRCNSSGGACAPISGATGSSYQLKTADIGSTIKAAVSATNSGGTTTATSDPTAVVTQAPPTNTALPTISGTVQQGQTLTASPGTWTGTPSYTYQWLRCAGNGAGCGPVAGATGSTYLLGSNDVDSTIRVSVTATNSGGAASATSAATAVVKDPPVNTVLPVISGPAHEGQTLVTTTGDWTGSPTGYAYQWRRCNSTGGTCANISGATNASYVPTGPDVGSTIRVVVTATNPGGSTPATSDPTDVITAAAFAPSVTSFTPSSGVPGATVTISGTRLYKASAVKFNGVAATITSNDATTIKALVPAAATDGPISITTQDGTATSGNSFDVLAPKTPKVSSFSPTSGVPGTTVTISGSGLLGATAVKFDGKTAKITSNTASTIKVIVPADATTGKVSVTTPGGTATSTQTFTAKPAPAPNISSFSPTSGPIGKIVTISGSGLLGATSVKFNGIEAAISSDTATAIKAIVPLGATTGKISVTTPGGTDLSTGNFVVKASPVPKITSFSPTSGVPGTLVTITGSGFLGATSVKFGGVESEIKSISTTSITVHVPPGAPSGFVSVTTPGGMAVSSGEFTVL